MQKTAIKSHALPFIRKNVLKLIRTNWVLYLFLVPAVAWIIIFRYWPIYGVQIAFRDYNFALGITGSKWVGLKWFESFISSPRFFTILYNTISLSLYNLAAGFPFPIILALMLNYVGNKCFKRVVQTITYMPHFISIIVMVGMLSIFLSPNSGFVNTIIVAMGGKAHHFFGDKRWFQHLYVWSGIWQEIGWGSIIYLAALSTINPELHESAVIDGANKLRRIWHIDIPSIMPTMVVLLIIRCGSIMSLGFDKSFAMQNSLNIDVSEIIATYNYKVGLQQMRYGYSTAINLFNNVINFFLLTIVNFFSRKVSGSSLW